MNGRALNIGMSLRYLKLDIIGFSFDETLKLMYFGLDRVVNNA